MSGAPLDRVVREAEGVRLKSNENLTLHSARPQIDGWTESVREAYAEGMKPSDAEGGAAKLMTLTGRG